jgi:anti-sigma factor RsiW
MLAAGGAAIWRISVPQTMEELAIRELSEERLDFRSDDPAQIRSWVQAKAGIDVELPASGGREVRLLGCRLMKRSGAPVVSIAYRVAGDAAALLVSRAAGSGAGGAHQFAPRESSGGARIFSWTMREKEYTIACSAAREPEAACLLCHSQMKL